mmetsp:Transcript_41238/g.66894  ORF Transcript_41238/g.66894 Transcript_41238/m.66894 type:complete len:318 (-) Transcript_41238:33-986(-)
MFQLSSFEKSMKRSEIMATATFVWAFPARLGHQDGAGLQHVSCSAHRTCCFRRFDRSRRQVFSVDIDANARLFRAQYPLSLRYGSNASSVVVMMAKRGKGASSKKSKTKAAAKSPTRLRSPAPQKVLSSPLPKKEEIFEEEEYYDEDDDWGPPRENEEIGDATFSETLIRRKSDEEGSSEFQRTVDLQGRPIQKTSRTDDELFQQDLDFFKQVEAQRKAGDGPSEFVSRANRRGEEKEPNIAQRTLTTILTINVFVVLLLFLWFLLGAAAKGLNIDLGPASLDQWIKLWTPFIQPAIGTMMAAAIANGTLSYLTESD